jgi:hypothetical protein
LNFKGKEMSTYPKWIYHKTKEAKIVHTKEEHDEHGDEWAESPAEFDADVVETEVTEDSEAPKKRGRKPKVQE